MLGVSLLLAALLCAAWSSGARAQTARQAQTLRSPNGRVAVTFALDGAGAPVYSVAYDGRPVIEPSRLALVFKRGGELSRGMTVTGADRRSHDEIYGLVAGKTSRARDRYRELTVSLAEAAGAGRKLQLVFRAYDGGAAFRYALPAQPALAEFEITAERSEFRFAADHPAWAVQFKGFKNNYENEFNRTTVGRISPGSFTGLPLVVEPRGGPTLAVAEADLKDYAGMYLEGIAGEPHALVTRLSAINSDVAVRAATPHRSPWRVVMIGDAPGRLVESTLIQNLSEPNAVGDASWVRPGKSAWDWWSGQAAPGATFTPGMNDATMKHYIDFASEFGLEYMLVDAGWYTPRAYGEDADLTADITKSIPEIDLPGLVRYARERNVGVVVWLNWRPARDQMDRAFPYYERIGVRGVKVDFMDRDDQEMVGFYHRILRTAARHHLLVDLHGAYKPTGLARTYPNYLTQEGVLGAEFNKWSARVTPTHNLTLPFTRMLLGPMDYTPAGFRNVTRAGFVPRDREPLVMTTRAHQLAMYVVYESPLQMVADHPGAYRGQPGAEFIKMVPTTWDETRVLSGRIGEWIVVARRRGREWFVGAMTNESARTLSLPLGFLGRGAHEATVFADGPRAADEPPQLSTATRRVRAADTLELRLAPAGGYAARIRPAAAPGAVPRRRTRR